MIEAQFSYTPEQFREWLEQQEPSAVVGVSRDRCCCPVAQWLIKGMGCHLTAISGRYCAVNGYLCPTPKWVLRFLMRVDAGDDRAEITAARCLEILDELEKENPLI